jgi:hypothetical protein
MVPVHIQKERSKDPNAGMIHVFFMIFRAHSSGIRKNRTKKKPPQLRGLLYALNQATGFV